MSSVLYFFAAVMNWLIHALCSVIGIILIWNYYVICDLRCNFY